MRFVVMLPALLLANVAYSWNFIEVKPSASQFQAVEFQYDFDVFDGNGQKIGLTSSQQVIRDNSLVLIQNKAGNSGSQTQPVTSEKQAFMPDDLHTIDQFIHGKNEWTQSGIHGDEHKVATSFFYDADSLLSGSEETITENKIEKKFTTQLLRDSWARISKELTFDADGKVTTEKVYSYDEKNGTVNINKTQYEVDNSVTRSIEHYLYDSETKQIVSDLLLGFDATYPDRSRRVIQTRYNQWQTTLTVEKHVYDVAPSGGATLLSSSKEEYNLLKTRMNPNAAASIVRIRTVPKKLEFFANNSLISRELFTYDQMFNELTRTLDDGAKMLEKSQKFYSAQDMYEGEDIYQWDESSRSLKLTRRTILRNEFKI